MARGASSTNVRDEDMESQGQETTRSFSQLVNSKANQESSRGLPIRCVSVGDVTRHCLYI